MRTIVRILIALVVLLVLFFLYQAYLLNFTYNQLSTQADRITLYFQNLVHDDIEPLSQTKNLTQTDATRLDQIRSGVQRAEQATTLPDTITELLSLQGALWQLLSHSMTPGIQADPHFADLRTRDNRPGEVYDLFKDYNQNVLLFNNQLQSIPGKLANQFFHYGKEQYLTIDGNREQDQVVNL